MSPAGAEVRPQPPRVWLFAVVGVLALVLLAIGYVQWRQFKLLDSVRCVRRAGKSSPKCRF